MALISEWQYLYIPSFIFILKNHLSWNNHARLTMQKVLLPVVSIEVAFMWTDLKVFTQVRTCLLSNGKGGIHVGYWPSMRSRWLYIGQVLFLRVYGPRWSQGPLTHKKRTRPISSHLDRTSLVNKGFIMWDKTPKHDKFSLRDIARIPSGQDSSILSARVANHSARFGSSCPLAELVF